MDIDYIILMSHLIHLYVIQDHKLFTLRFILNGLGYFFCLGLWSLWFWYMVQGVGNGTPLQYSCLENPMDRGAWWAAVHGVTTSWTRLSDFTFTFHFHALEKEMTTHSRILAWRIAGMGEPAGLSSMGSHRVGHDWSDLAAAQSVDPFFFPNIIVSRATCMCAQSSCRISLFLLISWPRCCCWLATLVLLSHFYVNFHFSSSVSMKNFTGISIGMMLIL